MAKKCKQLQPARRFSTGGAIDEYGNDLTRSNQMGAAASKMEAARIAREMSAANEPGQQVAALSTPQSINADMMNLGKINATPGEGEGAAHNWLVKSATDIALEQGQNHNAAYRAGGPGDPRASGQPSPMRPGRSPRTAPSLMQPVDEMFPARRGLASFAEGGAIKETPGQLITHMNVKYGVSGNQEIAAPPQPTSQPAPAQQMQPKAKPAGGLVGWIKSRKEQIDAATGYANGGKIQGPGTPTSDSIPAKVTETGEPIAVSTEERILSKKQDSLMQAVAKGAGFDSLDAMLEAGTGRPVGPTIKRGMSAAANGLQPQQDLQGRGMASQSLVSAAQNQMGLTPGKETGAGMVSVVDRGNKGLQAIAQNVGVRDTLNAAHEVQGDGIQYGTTTGANGKPQVMLSGTSPTKAQYIGADGKPTNEWDKTDAYQQAIGANVRMGNLADRMEQTRLKRDAFDPTITDDRVRSSARLQLAEGDRVAVHQGEAQNRLLESKLKQTKLDSETRLNSLQSAYANETDEGRREQLAQQIRGVMGRIQADPDRITAAQESNNLEIDAARKTVAGLNPDELRRRTSKQTNTGRENPDFDPTLERALTLSGRRKIGVDDHFDKKQPQEPPGNDGDKVTRFRADPAMKGHTMGKQTENGVEVLDASGKIIGHYR